MFCIIALLWKKYSFLASFLPSEIKSALSTVWKNVPFVSYLDRMMRLLMDFPLDSPFAASKDREFALWEVFESFTLGSIILYLSKYTFEWYHDVDFSKFINPLWCCIMFIANTLGWGGCIATISFLTLATISIWNNYIRSNLWKGFIFCFLQAVRTLTFINFLIVLLFVLSLFRIFLNGKKMEPISWWENLLFFLLVADIFIFATKTFVVKYYKSLCFFMNQASAIIVTVIVLTTASVATSWIQPDLIHKLIDWNKFKDEYQKSPYSKKHPRIAVEGGGGTGIDSLISSIFLSEP